MPAAAIATSRGLRANDAAQGMWARIAPWAGFSLFICFSCMYTNLVLIASMAALNFSVVTCLAQLAMLALCTLAASSLRRLRAPAALAAGACGALGAAAMLLFPNTAAQAAGAGMTGAALGGLTFAWGAFLARQRADAAPQFVLAAFALGSLVSLACSYANPETQGVVFAALPLLSALCAPTAFRHGEENAPGVLTADAGRGRAARTASKTSASGQGANAKAVKAVSKASAAAQKTGSKTQAAGARGSHTKTVGTASAASIQADSLNGGTVTWLMTAVLGVCAIVGSLFAGLAANPYAFQSTTVPRYLNAFALASFLLPLAWLQLTGRRMSRMLLVVPPMLLVCGLFLLSSGIAGSIIMPLGFSMAATSCCVAVCWVALAEVAHRRPEQSSRIMGAGLLLCSGSLASNAGIMLNRAFDMSFSQITLAASAAVVVLALLYVAASTMEQNSHARAAQQAALAAAQAEAKAARAAKAKPKQPAKPQRPIPPAPANMTPEEAAAVVFEGARPEGAAKPAPSHSTPTPTLEFTQQEMRIARLIVRKLTYQQIADECRITPRTVKFHSKNIFEKAGVGNRREFEAKVVSEGIHFVQKDHEPKPEAKPGPDQQE